MSKKSKRIEELRDLLAETAEAILGVENELPTLKKKKRPEAEAALAKLKKQRKKAHAELEKLAPGQYDKAGWAVVDSTPEEGERDGQPVGPPIVDEAAEAKAAGERHLQHLQHIADLQEERVANLEILESDAKKKAKAAATERLAAIDAELESFRQATEERAKEVAHETTGRNLKSIAERSEERVAGLSPEDAALRKKVMAKRAAREAGNADPHPAISDSGRTEAEVEAWLDKEGEGPAEVTKKAKKGKKAEREGVPIGEPIIDEVAEVAEPLSEEEKVEVETDGTTVAPEKALEDVDPVVQRDRWDRPIILTPEGEEKGYRRVTTFIDAIDDKTTLVDWKQRVVVVGVAAIEQVATNGERDLMGIEEISFQSVLARVEESNREFAAGMKAAKKNLKKGKLSPSEYDDEVAQIEKEQKAILNDLVAEAFKAGDGFLKAEAGTRIHYLAECMDKGEPLPEDTTDLERRDLAALQDAYRQLEWKTLDVERFVVRDDLQCAGTLDRRGSYISPSLGRRVVAIGDIKTGRMDFGAGKMARQLSAYAGGKGWSPANPEERVNLRCNREVGLIFHLPAGSGICTVYELDLKLGDKGLKLCQQIYDYRLETSTLKKVAVGGQAKGIVVGRAPEEKE